MRDTLYIRLRYDENEATWCYNHDRITDAVSAGSLKQLERSLKPGTAVCVFVPGNEVLMTRVKVPTRSRKRIEQAAPYILEEQIIGDIDSQHFAIGSAAANDEINIAVVKQEQIEKWLGTLRESGIHTRSLLPEVLALPWSPGQWTLLLEDDQYLLRTGEQNGLAIDHDNLGLMLQQAFDEADDKPGKIIVYQCETSNPDLPVLKEIEYETRLCPDGSLPLLIEGNVSNKGFNLLQGAYSVKHRLKKYMKPWKTAAGLAAAWLVLQLANNAGEIYSLDQQSKQLTEQQEMIYRTAFPNANRYVESQARIEMERKLKALQGDTSDRGEGALFLLAHAAPVLKQVNGISIQHIRGRQNEIEFELGLNDLQSLDRLKQQLTETGKLKVDIVSGSTSNGKVQGRIKIWSAS